MIINAHALEILAFRSAYTRTVNINVFAESGLVSSIEKYLIDNKDNNLITNKD
jgi:hypothetical protein